MATTTDATEIVNRIPYPNDSYSNIQNAVLAIVPKISGFLSFVSSCAIILDNLPTRSKQKRINTQRRLLLGLSYFDMIQSACHICSTWPVPKFASETYLFVKYNIGNQTSCTIQGFCLLFSGLTVPLYNAFLCLYYLICVKYPRMPPTRMSYCIEPFFHISAITYPICLAIYGLLNEMYNATGTTCFVVSYPKRCKIESYGVDCIRGRDADNLRKYITLTIGVCFIMITLSLSSLYYMVKKQEKRMSTYATHQYSRRDSVVVISSRSHGSDPSNQPMRQTKRVFRQALFYVIPFLIVWVPTLLQIIAANLTENPKVAYIMILLCSICAPLQGFFNAIVYYKERVAKRFSLKTTSPAIQDKIEENNDEPNYHSQNISTDFDVEDLQKENNIFTNENNMDNDIHLEFEEQDDIHVTQTNTEADLDIESEDHLDNEIATDKEETYNNLDDDEKKDNTDIMATNIMNDVYLTYDEENNKNNSNNSMEKDIHLEFDPEN